MINASNLIMKCHPLTLLVGCGLLVTAPFASAIIINLGGMDYDITTITGTFDNEHGRLEAQPWWGDFNLARDAARSVGSSLGQPNLLNAWGPFFVYGGGEGIFGSWSWENGLPTGSLSLFSAFPTGMPYTFAVANPVTAPEGGATGHYLVIGIWSLVISSFLSARRHAQSRRRASNLAH